MSTLEEIELATRRLTPSERQQLIILIAQSLRSEGQPPPQPRDFSLSQMQEWMDEDERDMKKLREQG
jgi:hypothetical protein